MKKKETGLVCSVFFMYILLINNLNIILWNYQTEQKACWISMTEAKTPQVAQEKYLKKNG